MATFIGLIMNSKCQQTLFSYSTNNYLNPIITQFFTLYFCLGLLGLSERMRSTTPASTIGVK